MRTEVNTKEKYFAAAGEREPKLRELDQLVREAAPDLEPVLFGDEKGKMLGYGLQPYRTKSMKQATEWPIVAIKNQKNYIGLYVCAVENGEYIAEKHAAELGVNVGKSCIRVTKLEKLNKSALRQLLRGINSRFKAGEQLYGM